MNKMDEQIIVVPRVALFNYGKLLFQGTENGKAVVQMLMDNIANNYGVMRRGDAEENTIFKQPIPYAVIRRGSEVFMYERLQGGGESRLHNKLSIGVGGHMNQFDTPDGFHSLLVLNMDRELKEELYISDDSSFANIIGFINDDSNEVGEVHIGILVVIDLKEDAEVEVREKDQLEGRWINVKELSTSNIYSRLENWSKIVVDTLSN
jgi:predicted NUDIX family phosphoesterase